MIGRENPSMDKVTGQIRARLTEARTAAYTTSSIVLVVAGLVVFHILAIQTELERTKTQIEEIISITNHAQRANVEIRKYLNLDSIQTDSLPQIIQPLLTEARTIQRIYREVESALKDYEHLNLQHENIIDSYFQHFRTMVAEATSDGGKHSIGAILLKNHLEQYRMRDLAELAMHASLDTFSTRIKLEMIMEKLHLDIDDGEIHAKNDLVESILELQEESLGRSTTHIDELREESTKYTRKYGPHEIGGEFSSLEENRLRTMEISQRFRRLMREIEGASPMEMPWIGHELRIRDIVLLLELGLIVGHAITAMLLMFSLQRLRVLHSIDARRAAADIGIVFTQLRKPRRTEAAWAWIVFILLLTVPMCLTLYLVYAVISREAIFISALLILTALLSVWMAAMVWVIGYRISTFVGKNYF